GEIIHDYVPGETFEGIVTKTTSFGAFVHLGEGAEGLLHVSEMGAHTEALPQEGARIRVRVKNVDDRGRISLSLDK
ncbi:MAG TPA: S1 RNA-binding domain-containing protein, partial [Candidatus Paceibacterota bacterium]|nr:S1 RNA-binding domain-containing protein [Candidatus Paceibacterota bacterium]